MFELSLKVRATKENIEFIDDVFFTALKECPKAKAAQFVLHELVINSIQAGERAGDCSKEMIISVSLSDEDITMRVKDYFGGFDSVTPQIDVWGESGRGLLLIDHLVRDYQTHTSGDGGFESVVYMTCREEV